VCLWSVGGWGRSLRAQLREKLRSATRTHNQLAESDLSQVAAARARAAEATTRQQQRQQQQEEHRRRDVQVVFAEPGPLGLVWNVHEHGNHMEMSVAEVVAGSAAATKVS
jgi:hypothetical protein